MLASPLTKETSRTVLARSDADDTPARISEVLEALEAEATEAMLAEGADPLTLAVDRSIDARYVGQSFELAVDSLDWVRSFHDIHLDRYGYARRETPVEAVTLRVRVAAPAPQIARRELDAAAGVPEARPLRVVADGTTQDATLLRREDLRAGHRVRGPAVVAEYSGTTWVPPGCRADVDAWGCLHLVFEA
jgi:N-methylhydantoinase A